MTCCYFQWDVNRCLFLCYVLDDNKMIVNLWKLALLVWFCLRLTVHEELIQWNTFIYCIKLRSHVNIYLHWTQKYWHPNFKCNIAVNCIPIRMYIWVLWFCRSSAAVTSVNLFIRIYRIYRIMLFSTGFNYLPASV
jgi:hypothetical protein